MTHNFPRTTRCSQGGSVGPLSPSEAVPDQILRDLAHGDPARQRGMLSAEDQAILSMILPDICGELLAYRRAAQVAPRGAARNHDDEIANIRFLEGDFTAATEPVDPRTVIDDDVIDQIKGLVEYLCDEAATSAVVLAQIAQDVRAASAARQPDTRTTPAGAGQ